LSLLIIYPAFASIKKGSAEIILKKGEMIALELQSKELDAFKKNYPSYKPNFEKLDDGFVDAQNPIDFIKFLENTAAEAGVAIEINLSSLQAKKDNIWQGAVLQISTKGYFLDILQFTEKLETGPYLMKVQKLTINTLPDDSTARKNLIISNANFSLNVITK
jgi:hypothetical protein